MSEQKEKIKRIIGEVLGMKMDDIGDQSEPTAMGADSLDATEITMEIENEFNIEFDDQEIVSARTIEQIDAAVTAKLAEAVTTQPVQE